MNIHIETSLSNVIAQALHDAGVEIVTYVPGYGANQVFEAYCEIDAVKHSISFNEEVSYTIAHGAGMVGSRAATIIKAHGFVKAGNSVVDSLFAGTTAGFVSIVFDDKKGRHSDSIFEIEAFLIGVDIPFLVADPDNIYNEVLNAFEQSEALTLPFVLLVDSNQVEQISAFTRRVSQPTADIYHKDVRRYFLQPVFGEYQRQVFEDKRKGADWRRIVKPAIPTIPDDLPETWLHHMGPYTMLFDVFKTIPKEIVTGDTGISHLFAFPPYDCFDLSTYMGGSLPLAIGAYLAGFQNAWALIGDFSFIAAGHMGLAEAVQRDIPLKTLIFFNGKAAATGGQAIPRNVWELSIGGYKPFVHWINDPQDRAEIETVLHEANDADEMRIIIADYRER